VSYDLATKVSSVISDLNRGVGANFIIPYDIAIDSISVPGKTRLLVSDPNINQIVSVDPLSGDRSTFVRISDPNLADIYFPSYMEIDAVAKRVLLANGVYGCLMSYDLVSAERRIISGSDPETNLKIGTGPSMDYPGHFSVAHELGVVFAYSQRIGAVLAIDMISGDRVVMSH
jgi:hypothetical protein